MDTGEAMATVRKRGRSTSSVKSRIGKGQVLSQEQPPPLPVQVQMRLQEPDSPDQGANPDMNGVD